MKKSLLKKAIALGLVLGGITLNGRVSAGTQVIIGQDGAVDPATYSAAAYEAVSVSGTVVDLGENVSGITTVSGGITAGEAAVYGVHQEGGSLTATSITDGIALLHGDSAPLYGISVSGDGAVNITGLGDLSLEGNGSVTAVSLSGSAGTAVSSLAFGEGKKISLKSNQGEACGIKISSGTLTVEGLGDMEVTGSTAATKLYVAGSTLNLKDSTVGDTENVVSLSLSSGTVSLQGKSSLSGKVNFEGSNNVVNIASEGEWHTGDVAGTGSVTINNSGKVVFEKTAALNGGTLANNGGTVSVAAKEVSLGKLTGSEGAETYIFALSDIILKDDIMLTIVDSGFAFNAGDNITVSGTLSTALNAGEKIVLIDSNDTLSLENVNLDCSIAGLSIGLSSNSQDVVLFAPPYLTEVKPSNLTGNVVEITSASGATVNGSALACSEKQWLNVYGGYAEEDGAVSDNQLTIAEEGSVDGKIYGGYSAGSVSNNQVIINGGNYDSGNEIAGGYGVSGDAGTDENNKGNKVTVNDGYFSGATLAGGISENGDANYNTLEIKGGTFESGNIYGGLVKSTEKVAQNNRVVLDSNVQWPSDASYSSSLFGGYNLTDGAVCKTGNILEVYKNTTNSSSSHFLKEVGGFETYTFDLTGVGKNNTLIQIDNSLDLDNANIIITNFSTSALEGGDSVNLMDNVQGSFVAVDTKVYSLVVDNDQLVLKLAVLEGAVTSVKPESLTANKVTVTSVNRATVVQGEESVTVRYNDGMSMDGTWKNVYGGFTEEEQAAASNNSVVVSADVEQVMTGVFGGYSVNGYANYNEVTIEGSDFVTEFVLGGFGKEEANYNQVFITGGTFNNDIEGGESYISDSFKASSSNNKVIIEAGFFGDEVAGGYVYAYTYGSYISVVATNNSNQVTIQAGDFTGRVTGGFVRNYACVSYGGSALVNNNSNQVTIQAGDFAGMVAGGYVYNYVRASYGGSVLVNNNSNQVTIQEGMFGSTVAGGYLDSAYFYAYYGNATLNNNSNCLAIEAGTFGGLVTGGYLNLASTYYSSVNNNSNTINIVAGTFNQDVAGGYVNCDYSDYSSVNNNSNVLTIAAGIFNGAVAGAYFNKVNGYSYFTKENSNTVTIEAGSFGGVLAGGYFAQENGYTYYVTQSNNTVTIEAGTFSEAVGGGYFAQENGDTNHITQNNNTVSIEAGTFSEAVAGGYFTQESGYSYYVTQSNNTVTIEAGTFSEAVAGGYFAQENGYSYYVTQNNNTVTITAGILNTVAGAYMEGASYGLAVGNEVQVQGGTITGYVAGAYLTGNGSSSHAYANKAVINGGLVEGIVYGGYSTMGDAGLNSDGNFKCGNSVVITGAAEGDIKQVYGGCSASGYANYNSVLIDGEKLGTVGTEEEEFAVVGGYSEKSGVWGNQVEIAAGTYQGNIMGGYSAVDNAFGNEVLLEGGYTVGSVYGSYAPEGSVSAYDGADPCTRVEITDAAQGELEQVVGGYAGSGVSAYNYVTIDAAALGIITGGAEGFSAAGGYAKSGYAQNNGLDINAGTYAKLVAGAVVGESTYTNNNINNSVTITGGTFKDGIYGVYALAVNTGNSANRVLISDSIDCAGNIAGSYGGGSAVQNKVVIDATAMGIVQGKDGFAVAGGYTSQSTAQYNTVEIVSGTYEKFVVGGYAGASNGQAFGNGVSLAGGTYQDTVYGGYGSSAGSRNLVTAEGNFGGTDKVAIVGGYAALQDGTGEASGNAVVIKGGT